MRIDVALLPGQAPDTSRSVCVVVDVLRASSSIVALLERGAPRILPAASIDEARALRARFPDHLLCGEVNGLPPDGFDYGNSPSEFSALDLAGRPVILATSNGTRLLAALADACAVLVGCLLNRAAAVEAAVALAAQRDPSTGSGEALDIAVVCSAAYGGSTFVLEDALGAGAIVDAALARDPAPQPSDAARFARHAFLTARRDLPAAVASAHHARELIAAGLAADVAYCARLDTSRVVPRLERGEDGVLVVVRGG